MHKAFKYRIYPNTEQKALIEKHIGACRFVYNLSLEVKQMTYTSARLNLSAFDLMKQLTDLKKDCTWLNEINAQSLQLSIVHLDAAYTSFFKGRANFPRFKRKNNSESFTVRQGIKIESGRLKIPKFTPIKIVTHRPYSGRMLFGSLSKTSTGKYFFSLVCETPESEPRKKRISESTTTGVDLGLKTFLVASDGSTFDNPRFLRKMESRLKFKQRKYSKHKGKRTRKRLATLHEKVANQRKDFLHKASSTLVKNHDSIAIEDLNIAGMLQNHCLAKSVSDAGWYEFTRQLQYKADWYGKNILRIGRFDPSSKTCSSCGKINKELTLKDREWSCPCGVTHDRDMNAALNIKNFALKNYLSTGRRLKNRKELPTLVGVMMSEGSKN